MMQFLLSMLWCTLVEGRCVTLWTGEVRLTLCEGTIGFECSMLKLFRIWLILFLILALSSTYLRVKALLGLPTCCE